jgi:hypothetical protein
MAKPHDSETVADLLSDPLIRALMRADRVEATQLEASLNGIAARLQRPGRRTSFAGVTRLAGERSILVQAPPFVAGLNCIDVCQNSVGW